MRLSALIGWAFLVAGCASPSVRPALNAMPDAVGSVSTSVAANAEPEGEATPSVETSHVYLLSPGKDAVRIVVSR
jgi:hypothetical protein